MKNYLLRIFTLGLFILACASCANPARQHAALEVADDLAATGKASAQRGAPIMLVFTRPDCPYCARAKRDHLEAMRASPGYGAKVIMREIVVADNRTALRDFEGLLTTHDAFARTYDIRAVPTVIVVDAHGRTLADPIVGLTTPDFYNLYLEQAIDVGRLKLRQE